jgi:RNA polymerase sigma-70 factor, ECF subfamily
MDLQEQTIWRKIQHKDIATFERFYKEHYKSFYLLACKYIKNSSEAEEIVNDIFMKIWEDGNKIQIETSIKSYINKAVINRSINALNKSKRENEYRSEMNSMPGETFELREIEENELKIKLYEAIDQLPDQCKKVFEMSRFEELKQQEIADKLGISIKTVKNHITIALKKINESVVNYILLFIMILILKN